MNRPDNFFETFRRQQHQLEEMPSPQTWDRLQKRLDNRKKRRSTTSIYRLFTMAAAILGLVLTTVFVANLSNPVRKQALKTEELPNYSPKLLQKAIEANAYRSTHQTALQQTIEEGSPTKLLVHKKAARPILVPKKKIGI